jgi:L-2,4-diaminobutyrate decarboxylase
MSQLILDAFDPDAFRQNGHRLIDILADYLKEVLPGSNSSGNTLKPLPWQNPDELADFWRADFSRPAKKDTETEMAEFCQNLISRSIHLHHPGNMGHQVSAPAPMASLMELVSALLNNSMAIYEVGPSSTAIEQVIIEWLGGVLGMEKHCGGILTSGGSGGNLTGLLAARQHKTGYDIWETGSCSKQTHETKPLAVMVSADSHYSIARAVKIMGWGQQGIVKIPVNHRREIDPGKLEETYQRAVKEGKHVIAVAANACSTSTGSYDPLEAVAGFCRSHDLWFHVDAAHGGGAALTSKYKHRIKGIQHADSVVVDFHKMMLCPSLTTAVMFKSGDSAYETFSQKADYLLSRDQRGEWYDIANRTLECTKKMMGIKVYALLKIYGPQLIDDYVTGAYELAETFADLLEEAEDFELALHPASNIVCFRYSPAGADAGSLDELNAGIRRRLLEDGEFYIVQTVIDGRTFLRTTLMNPFTSKKELLQLMDRIRTI